MNGSISFIAYDVAKARGEDLLCEAAAERLAGSARRSRPAATDVLRRQVGATLVRAGRRLQGVPRRRVGEELASAGELLLAR